MQYIEFIGKVQNLAGLESTTRALSVTRVTLQTLATRLSGEQPDHIAAHLPEEIGRFLTDGRTSGAGERFSLNEFYQRVAKLTGDDEPSARHHASAVMSVLRSAISERELRDMSSQLPEEFDPLVNPPEAARPQRDTSTTARPARRGRRKKPSNEGEERREQDE